MLAMAGIPAVGIGQLAAQAQRNFRLRSGLVAYSYRAQLAAKSMSYEDLIRRIADWGLDGLDCTVYWLPEASNGLNEYLAKLRRTAYQCGVSIYNAGVRVRLCQPTRELQVAQFENIRKWVDVTDRLGAGHMRVFGGTIPKGASEEQAISWAVEVLKRGAEYAGERGIILGVEDDGGLTTTAEPTVAIVQQTGSPWVGINVDSGNLPRNGYSQFEMMLPYATSVHLKPEIAGADGKKEPADWDRLLGMLGKAGYKGYVGLEYEEEGAVAEAEVPRLAARLRSAVRRISG